MFDRLKNFARSAESKVLAGGALAGTALGSFAAVPADVSTALGDAAVDAASVGGLALIAVVAAVAFKYMRRAL